jgi:hypothetical protein
VERHLERSRKIAEESTRNIAAYSHQMRVVDPGDLDLDSEMEDYEESEQSNNQGDQFDAEDTQDELLDQYSQQNHHIDEIGVYFMLFYVVQIYIFFILKFRMMTFRCKLMSLRVIGLKTMPGM